MEVFPASPTRKGPSGRPRPRERDYTPHLLWEYLGIPQKELASVARENEVWNAPLILDPPIRVMDEWMCAAAMSHTERAYLGMVDR